MTSLLMLMALCGQPWPKTMGYPGRFSTLRDVATRQTMTANGAYALDTERVLKINAIVPVRVGKIYGDHIYAGSMSLYTPAGHWQQDLPDTGRTMRAEWPSRWTARVTQTVTDGNWTGQIALDMAADDPSLGFTLRRVKGGGALTAGLIGWGWANKMAPTDWLSDGKETPRKAGSELKVAPKGPAAMSLLFHDDTGFIGALEFQPSPVDVTVNDDGVTWSYKPDVAEAHVVYILFPAMPALSEIDDLIDRFSDGPHGVRQTFGCDGGVHGKPWVEMEDEQGQRIVLPPSLADETSGRDVPLAEGVVRQVDGGVVQIGLDVPPLLEKIAPNFGPLPEASREKIEGWAKEILAHQSANGAFSFGLKRGFYDGITCAALADVLGVVSPQVKAQIEAGLAKGLGHLWNDEQPAKAWPGIMAPPEQKGFYQLLVDYPEIESCVLQATAVYCAQGHKDYAVQQWPKIQQQFEQLRWFYDISGIALAAPGPAYWHVIAESAIGGYLGWQALYHLAVMADRPAYAEEARARAALAWKAWKTMFAWRKAYGKPPAVVNGIDMDEVQCMTEPPWAYVQSAWFTFLPGFALPKTDSFGVWRRLTAQPWWEYTGAQRSTQRAYDACDAIALARAGLDDEIKAHWAAVSARPFLWDSFDQTPVLAMAAAAWLNAAP